MPTIARIAAIVAFLFAALTVVSAMQSPILLPFAVIPLAAGIAIWRRRSWGAYGFALALTGQLLALPLLMRGSASTSQQGLVATTVIISALAAVLFFFAGRSLTFIGSPKGMVIPWIAIAVAPVVLAVFVQAYVIPTGAMEDTLLIGDHILAQRFPVPAPHRRDISVFVYPIDRTQTFIKRVVGVPGDRIRITHKVLFLNGAPQQEAYVSHKTDYEDAYRDNFPNPPNVGVPAPAIDMLKNHVVNGEVVVPDGKYFVLGDNRDSSLDSRYWGFVDNNDALGKPLLIYSSKDTEAKPPQTRWNRTFKLL